MSDMQAVIPALRITDYDGSRKFYLDGLGFTVDWEHRFAPGMPVFAQISKDGLILRLTQHSGDANTGALVFLNVHDVDTWYQECAERIHVSVHPEDKEWRSREWLIIDPDGNRLCINTPLA